MNTYKSLSVIALAALMTACGSTNSTDKKEKLESLKKEQAKISAQIKEIEAELAKNDTSTNKKVRYVEIADIKNSNFKHFIDIQGKVEAIENVNVSAQMPGTVTNIYVTEGQAVKKGQVLAQLNNAVLLSQVEVMKTNLALANTVYNRQKALWDQKIGTEIQFLQAQANKEGLERQLATMNDQIELSRIKSPINGTVDAVIAKLGDAASPGVPAFRVVNASNLKAKATVAESYAANVKIGDQVKVLLPDLNKEIDAKVTFVSRSIDPLTRSFTVEVKMPSDPTYRANMVAVLKIVDYSAANAVIVPINAVQNVNNETFVLTAEKQAGKDVATKKIVKVGRTYNSQAEITGGLTEGEKLIVVGYQGLNNGEAIKF
ncbi:efflux RND transporter periplasmic adaptor subunit [Solitalea sp. MAHUQ-68]|uniref:Efflux RND transporter periplasmic adaptor subunit n=1 Tax=Solitalea agri TaxID=2953739 RepID=A0A9X2F8Y3_9SPHI|nr:efflux RND transporter periplasmic adaptor subunit [Solitalea agri]MCO4294526.1 efflux RND transporter periplasmic adaptor subunit [Solitalea agri]